MCVDNFGVKFYNDDDKKHLIEALHDKYEITIDTTGSNFCGLTLKWNHIHGYVDMSMPGFVTKTLNKLNFKPTRKKQLVPHEWRLEQRARHVVQQPAEHRALPELGGAGLPPCPKLASHELN